MHNNHHYFPDWGKCIGATKQKHIYKVIQISYFQKLSDEEVDDNEEDILADVTQSYDIEETLIVTKWI